MRSRVDAGGVSVQVLDGFGVGAPTGPMPVAGIPADAVKAVAVHGPLHSEELIELLWPESDASVGRARLRNVLARARRSCGPLLVRDSGVIRLDGAVSVDLDAFEREADAALAGTTEQVEAVASRAVDRYGMGLLPYDRYVDWLAVPRERTRRRVLWLLELLGEQAIAGGRVRDAVRVLERAIDIDPHDEDRYLVLADVLAAHGRPGAARATAQRGCAAIAELGLCPTGKLADLGRWQPAAGSVG